MFVVLNCKFLYPNTMAQMRIGISYLSVVCTTALLCVWFICRSVCCNWRNSRGVSDSFFDLSGSQQTPDFSLCAETQCSKVATE